MANTEKIKTEVNGKEAGEATVTETIAPENQSVEAPKKDGKLKKIGQAIWNNRGKIGVVVGSGLMFLAMCLLGKDNGSDVSDSDEGPTE